MESRMRWKSHVRFGGRIGETHRSKERQGAPVRPYERHEALLNLAVVRDHRHVLVAESMLKLRAA